MPLRLEIKKNLTSRSDRVKCVDIHPKQPLILAALYSGSLSIWNYESQTLIKSFEATSQPIRCAKFIVRKQWIVAGSDDMMLRFYNFNTLEKVAEFEAHVDYIRSLEVHPTFPYVLSASDDMQIKLWDWDKLNLNNIKIKVDVNSNTQSFDGHAHYIMCIKFNPKDSNAFATASLDRSIKFWSLGSPLPNYSLEGHEQGVNALDFFLGGEKPYLISGADDMEVRIWDYQTKTCVQILKGHTGNISSVIFHPNLPLIISAAEDGTVRLWHSITYRLETTLNYGMERAWCVAASKESSKICIGFDDGTVVISLGSDSVLASMDNNNGKILTVSNNEISQIMVRKRAAQEFSQEGDVLSVDRKQLGACEIYPQAISHNSNGRFVALVGDGEYIIYTSQALRSKTFGQCLDFAWSSEVAGDFALLKTSRTIKIVRNFDEKQGFEKRLGFNVDSIHSGPLLGLVFGSGEFLVLLHWQTGLMVRKIDFNCSKIIWNQSSSLIALIAPEEGGFIVSCDFEQVLTTAKQLEVQQVNTDEDYSDQFESCFLVSHEIPDPIEKGVWVGDCLLYVLKTGTKLSYFINGESVLLANLESRFSLLDYVAKANRVFLINQQQELISFELLECIIQYQTAVVRGDFEMANQILPQVPQSKMNDVARFLEGQNYKEVALGLALDFDLKFSLAISLGKLSLAFSFLKEAADAPNAEVHQKESLQQKWRQLSDLALSKGNLILAEECAIAGLDLESLLLIYSSLGDKIKLQMLQEMAKKENSYNIVFCTALLLEDRSCCVSSLLSTERASEAAIFSRAYCPDETYGATESWKQGLLSNEQHHLAASIKLPVEL